MAARFQCFVTGTDTEIGKTLISSAILHGLVQAGVKAAGMKPIAAGAEMRDGLLHNDDVAQLVAASNVALPRELVVPWSSERTYRAICSAFLWFLSRACEGKYRIVWQLISNR